MSNEIITISSELEEEAIRNIKTKLEEALFLKRKVSYVIKCDTRPSISLTGKIFDLFFDYKSATLEQIIYPEIDDIKVTEGTIHSGEIRTFSRQAIHIGNANTGSQIIVENSLSLSGTVSGEVVLKNDNSYIFANHYLEAKVISPHNEVKIVSGDNLLISSKNFKE